MDKKPYANHHTSIHPGAGPQSFKPSFWSRFRLFRLLQPQDVRLILAVTLFIWGWMLAYSVAVYQPQYASSSMVIIKDSAITQRYVDTDMRNTPQTTSSNASNPVLNTMGLLKSATIMDALWRFFKTEHPQALAKMNIETQQDWEAFYGDGSALLKAKNVPGTDLISLHFTWTDPKTARECLTVVLNAFQKASLDINRAEDRIRSHYLDEQVEKMSTELAAVRKQKSAYKSQMNTVSIEQERNELAKARIDMENQLNLVTAQARGKQAESHRFQQLLGMPAKQALTASAIGQNTTLAKLYDQRYALNQTYAQLSASLTDNNPKVQEVRSQLAQLDQDIEAEKNRTLSRIEQLRSHVSIADASRATVANQMASAHAEAANLATMANTLRSRLSEVKRQINAMPNVEEELANIEQKERALSLALDTLHQKKLEAHLKEAQTLSNVFVVDAPRLPMTSKFPTRFHLILIGFVLGLLGGVTAFLIKHKILSSRFARWAASDEAAHTLGQRASHPVDDPQLTRW